MNSGLESDPYELNSYIGKIVSVQGLTGSRRIGRLIALDPVSSSVVLIVSSSIRNNNIDNSAGQEEGTDKNLIEPVGNSDNTISKSSKKPSNTCSETIKKEIVVLPWIDLSKLSVVVNDKVDLETAEQDQKIREKLLLSTPSSCFHEKNADESENKNSSNHTGAPRDPEKIVNWLKKHQLSVEFANETISIQSGLVKLKHPYTANDCQATNLIVLDRVTSILAQMPPL